MAADAQFGELTPENKVQLKRFIKEYKNIREEDKPEVPQIQSLEAKLKGVDAPEQQHTGSRFKQGAKSVGTALLKAAPMALAFSNPMTAAAAGTAGAGVAAAAIGTGSVDRLLAPLMPLALWEP